MTKRKRLSSILTFPYKYIVPLVPIGLAIFVNLVIDKESNKGYFIPVNLFFLIFFLIPFIQLKNIKKVEYNKNNLIISNFFKTEIYQLKDVTEVKRWFFYFYKIYVKTNEGIRKIQFIPSINERMIRPFKKLDSIIEFEKRIKN